MATTRRLRAGEITAAQMVQEWTEFSASADEIKQELGKLKKDALVGWAGLRYARETKPVMVKGAWTGMCFEFVHDRTLSYGCSGMGDHRTLEEAVQAKIGGWTDAMIAERAAARRAEAAARDKSWQNPETLAEFNEFVRHHGRVGVTDGERKAYATKTRDEVLEALKARGLAKLSVEQRRKYDELLAESTKSQRAIPAPVAPPAEPAPSPQVAGDAAVSGTQGLSITEATHTRDGYKIWVVTLGKRLSDTEFAALRTKAKECHGWYSSYRGNGAIPGFIFKEQAHAEGFMSGQVVSERVADPAPVEDAGPVPRTVADKLREAGENAIERAEEQLEAPRKTNTARRASIASSIEARARDEIQVARTAVNLAEALAAGELRFLDKIAGYVAPVRVMDGLLDRGIRDMLWRKRDRGEITYSQMEAAREGDISQDHLEEAIDGVRFPWPYVEWRQFHHMVEAGLEKPGVKRQAARAARTFHGMEGGDRVPFPSHLYAKEVRDLAKEVGERGKHVLAAFSTYDALVRLNIQTSEELRCALREFVKFRGELVQQDPFLKAERALRGTQIPGFFPTPAVLARNVVEQAGIEAGMRVLEPSAGKGDLCMAVKAVAPEAMLEAVEVSSRLHPLLEARGVTLAHRDDFLSYNPGPVYDRIVMNPPFEDGQDIEHVRHAYSLLAPGGRLVAIMSEGAFSHEDRRAREFRSWVEANEGISERNPEGSFAGADAFRQTGVHTRTLVVDKAALRQECSEATAPVEVPVEAVAAEHEAEGEQLALQMTV